MKYLFNKKEAGTGVLLSFIVPGGGHFYAENGLAGTVYLLGETSCMVWGYMALKLATENMTKPNMATAYYQEAMLAFIIAGILKIIDIVTVPNAIDNYNESLIQKISLGASSKGISLKLTF